LAFYGLPPDDHDKVIAHSNAILEIYQKNGRTVISADNMLLAMRTTHFFTDPEFSGAILEYCYDPDGLPLPDNLSKFWRLHVYTWACAQGMRLEGSLVECGVHMGLYSLVMMKSLDFNNSDKDIYLYDTFEGLADELSTARERLQVEEVYDIADWEQQVRESFAPYPKAHVIRGKVPTILADTAPETVSFLHIDMNAALAEVAALDFFQSRLVPGAIILLDDFGRSENSEICQAHTEWFGAIGKKILELPTGQGIVLWR